MQLSRYQESIIYKFGKIEPERVVAPVVINARGTKVVFLIINHNPLSRGVALRKTLGDVAIQVELKLDDTSFANKKFASITYWRVNREGRYTCAGFCDVEPTAGRVIDRYAGAKPDGWVDQIYDTGKINYSKMFIDILTTPATTFVDYGFYYTKV